MRGNDMTHRRAIWEALAMVVLPTSLVWGYFGYKAGFHWEELPIYVIFALLPVVLLVPFVYLRIMDGPVKRELTRRQHIQRAVWMTGFAIFYLIFALWHPRNGWDQAWKLAMSLGWFASAASYVWGAVKTENSSSVATQ